jgi:hypothetical protein
VLEGCKAGEEHLANPAPHATICSAKERQQGRRSGGGLEAVRHADWVACSCAAPLTPPLHLRQATPPRMQRHVAYAAVMSPCREEQVGMCQHCKPLQCWLPHCLNATAASCVAYVA